MVHFSLTMRLFAGYQVGLIINILRKLGWVINWKRTTYRRLQLSAGELTITVMNFFGSAYSTHGGYQYWNSLEI